MHNLSRLSALSKQGLVLQVEIRSTHQLQTTEQQQRSDDQADHHVRRSHIFAFDTPDRIGAQAAILATEHAACLCISI